LFEVVRKHRLYTRPRRRPARRRGRRPVNVSSPCRMRITRAHAAAPKRSSLCRR